MILSQEVPWSPGKNQKEGQKYKEEVKVARGVPSWLFMFLLPTQLPSWLFPELLGVLENQLNTNPATKEKSQPNAVGIPPAVSSSAGFLAFFLALPCFPCSVFKTSLRKALLWRGSKRARGWHPSYVFEFLRPSWRLAWLFPAFPLRF